MHHTPLHTTRFSLLRGLPSIVALALCLISAVSFAQEADAEGEPQGIDVPVTAGEVKRVLLALPPAINAGSSADTTGVGERLNAHLERALSLSGYFDLLERDLFPTNPSTEGMNPNFVAWFNSGSQGLIKAAFELQGESVTLTLKLFDVSKKSPVALAGGVDQRVTLKRDPALIKAHVARFINQVIKHYTGGEGFFGTRIVAVKKNGRSKAIVLVNPDGSGVSTLTKSGKINLLPSISKGRVYFTSYRDGGPNLYRYDRGRVSTISARKGLNMGGALSPSGRFLVASLSYQGSSDIYLLNPETGDILRRLTKTSSIDISPSWSPDGKQIVFVSDREGSPQLWLMNADGSNQRRLTFQGRYNQSPSWSPKGDQIAFTSRDEKYVFDIFTIDPKDPTKLTRLTQNQGNNENPSWSPDGRHLVFSSTRSGISELYIMTSDGFTQRALTKGGGYSSPSWGE